MEIYWIIYGKEYQKLDDRNALCKKEERLNTFRRGGFSLTRHFFVGVLNEKNKVFYLILPRETDFYKTKEEAEKVLSKSPGWRREVNTVYPCTIIIGN